jgi:hypothetical protein
MENNCLHENKGRINYAEPMPISAVLKHIQLVTKAKEKV